MHILIFSVAYFPFVGGAEIAVKEITDRIGDFSFDMITLNLEGKQCAREKIGNVMVYRIGSGKNIDKILYPFFAYIKARRLHKIKKYSAVWSIMASYSGFAALFFKMSSPKIPFLLTLQEGDPILEIRKKIGLLYPLFKRIFLKADFIQAISNYLANWAESLGGKKIEVVPNGVDFEKFTVSDSRVRQNIREVLGLRSDDFVVISTSRLVVKNGLGDLIMSLKFLPQDIKLLLLGQGEYQKYLENIVSTSKLQDRVKFLGKVDYNKLPQYYLAADVFARPSLSEGMGNSFIEAMAVGLPVIGTAVGGIPDFLINKKTGLFCNTRDPKDLASKILIIKNDSKLAEELVQSAREYIRGKYEWKNISFKIESIFKQLASPYSNNGL